jgi:ABC-type lipoprotein release transport system permease subunit
VAIGGVVILLSAAVFLACYIPARPAAKLDPTAALRFE